MPCITLPTFYCPFPPEIHPQVAEVNQHTFTWATEHGLLHSEAAIKRFHASRFAWLAGRIHTRCSFDELALCNDFNTYLFFLDDQFDDSGFGHDPAETALFAERLLASLGIPLTRQVEPLRGPLATAMQDLWARMQALGHPEWERRFLDHFRAYLSAYTWEAGLRRGGEPPSMGVFIKKREEVSAMFLALDCIELTNHVYLPAEVYYSTLVQGLLLIINHVGCWQNDIFSLEKEVARGDYTNIVLVLQKERQCSLQAAAELANDLVTREVKHFETLEATIPTLLPDYQEDLDRLLYSLRNWVRANIDWSLETSRYNVVEQTAAGQNPSYLEHLL
jgi:5-epi-alpha-selinene synthase